MTETTDNTSPTASLYTELPYPGDGVIRTTVSRMLRRSLERVAPHLLTRSDLSILEVGCGTGEGTAGVARDFPGARVVAVDVNPASLDMAGALAREHDLDIEFYQCDVSSDFKKKMIDMGALREGDTFDIIISMGVLHCLTRPVDGFAQVRDVVADDGLFLCYVYSTHGRRDVLAARAVLDPIVPPGTPFAERARALRLLKVSTRHSLLGIARRLKHRLRFGPPVVVKEMLQVLRRRNFLVHGSDIYSCPNEYMYEFADLQEIFAQSGWSFVSLAPAGGLPTTIEEHTRDPEIQELLRQMPEDALYDYFAYHYNAGGFSFLLKPGDTNQTSS